MPGCFTSDESLFIHVQDRNQVSRHITSFLAWAWSAFDWLCFSVYFSISCRHCVSSGLSAYRFREAGQLFHDFHEVPCLRRTGKSCSLCWIAQFYPGACSSTPDAFVQASLGTRSRSCRLLCSAARSADWLLVLCSPMCKRSRRGSRAVARSHISCFVLRRLTCTSLVASTCLLWGAEKGRRSLCFRPTTHLLGKPMISQALAAVQEGKAVMAGLFWGVLSRTSFPQLSGLQPCAAPRSPLGIVDLCTCKTGENGHTPCRWKTEA